jgi:hypothetical protein
MQTQLMEKFSKEVSEAQEEIKKLTQGITRISKRK